MQKFVLTSTISLLALAMVMPGALAGHSGCSGVVTTVPLEAETLYIDDRSGGAATINHWFYLESGDAEGLQTGGSNDLGLPDSTPILIFVDDCDHGSDQDTLLL